MAQRATVLVGKAAPAPKRAGRSTRAPAEVSQAPQAIAVDLRKLLAPYKKRGRLTLRAERMPPLARFSAGRNNGDNTWSFTLDELEDLEFLPAPGFDEAVTLAIRIIAHDSVDASTVAVIDYEISPDGATAAAEPGDTASNVTMEQLRRLRDEMAEMARRLAERDADLEDAAAETKDAEARLERARKLWQAETDAKLQAAQKDAAEELARRASEWQRQSDARLASAEERANARSADAQAAEEARAATDKLGRDLETMRKALAAREAELAQLRENVAGADAATGNAVRKAIATAETLWKAGEAARLAAAQAQWREQTEQALAEARASAKKSSKTERGETVRLHGELAVLRTQLAEREGQVTQLRASVSAAKAESESATDSALARAKELWKAEEAARLAAAEERWREQSERALIQAQSAATSGDTVRMREELAGVRRQLDERTAELQQMQSALVQSRAQQEDALKAALARAAESWKAEEAARLVAAQAQWTERSARAVADTQKSADELRSERDRERSEAETLRQYLAKRDAEIEQLRATLASAEPKAEQAVRAALLKAEDVWKAGEALRMATAEARWREQADRAIAEALSSAKKTDSQTRGELDRLNGELASLRHTLGERDAEVAQLRASLAEAGPKAEEAARAALAKAEEGWKAAEAVRLAEAQAAWRAQSEQALGEAHAAAQQSLGEERGERARLDAALSDLRKQLGERDGEIAQLKTAFTQARAEHERGLADAEQAWKAGEAVRLAAAETQWQDKAAALKAELEAERERIKADAAANSANLSAQHAGALQGLRGEIADLREMLNARERELAEARKAATAAEKRAAGDIDTARANAERETRERFQARLAEATARYEAAESALVEMRMRTGNHTTEDAARLLDEISTLRTVLANRETELAQFRHREEHEPPEPEQISLVHEYRGLIMSALVAASVAMGAVLLFPQLVPLLPYGWQVKYYEMNGQIQNEDTPAPAVTPKAAAPAPLPKAVVARGVNLRAEASTRSNVISTLAAGTDVRILETQGGWTHVRVADGADKAHEGWVFSTFLKAK